MKDKDTILLETAYNKTQQAAPQQTQQVTPQQTQQQDYASSSLLKLTDDLIENINYLIDNEILSSGWGKKLLDHAVMVKNAANRQSH